MRIKSLSLKNIRLFGDKPQTVSFDADKNVVILLGNNGCGKSTILDAASILLSSYVGSFPGNTAKSFKDSDVHILSDNQVAPIWMFPWTWFWITERSAKYHGLEKVGASVLSQM